MVGRSLRYVAEVDGQWLALLGWASAALKCAARDRWIGWPAALQWQRIGSIANNTRFLILPGAHIPNLASKVLSLNLRRLSRDWQSSHGSALLLAETFVDPSRFAGTCYKAANWQLLGLTQGFAKTNQTYVQHDAAKQIWTYPLRANACAILSMPQSHPLLSCAKVKPMALNDQDAQALFAQLKLINDPRSKRGLRHSQHSLLAMMVCAVISGASGAKAIAEWVGRLNPAMLRRLRCRRSASGQFERPSEPTIRRMLTQINIEQLESQLGSWLTRKAPKEEAIALDGKTLKGSRSRGDAVQLVSALGHDSGVVLHQVPTRDKSNEITAVQPLLESLDLRGRIVTADALHTQTNTAKYLVEEKQAHYLLTVKGNQPFLKQSMAQAFEPLLAQSLPPCALHS
jgi:hypothetical protein